MAKASATVNKFKNSIMAGVGIAIGGIIVGFVMAQLAKRGISLPS